MITRKSFSDKLSDIIINTIEVPAFNATLKTGLGACKLPGIRDTFVAIDGHRIMPDC